MERLDRRLVRLGLLPSRETAQEEVRAGRVQVNGRIITKPGLKLKDEDQLEYTGEGRKYVSRGAFKLLGAKEAFGLQFEGKKCLDVGASTGGFSQVLLEGGAASVTALDVGHGQLDPLLRRDPKIREISGVNFRDPDPAIQKDLQNFDFLTMDVSFISACLLIQSVQKALVPGGEALILIKPQFEAGRGALNKNGVVTDPLRHVEVLTHVIGRYQEEGFEFKGLEASPIQGPEGNIEYLFYLTRSQNGCSKQTETESMDAEKLEILAKKTVEKAFQIFRNSGSKLRGSNGRR